MERRSWTGWAIALGIALGGFFDGILLHQILQWHHLLSLVPGMESLRDQVLWDGYFHALMYAIAAVALWALWRRRREMDARHGRPMTGALLIGFGLWHVIDAVLSHWLLGIHRVKIDSANPLAWDLAWFAIFGLVPIAAGWRLLRRRDHIAPGGGAGVTTLLLLAAVTGGAALWSLRTPPDQRFTTIVFAPGKQPRDIMNALVAQQARIVWAEPSLSVVVVDVPASHRMGFYRQGALLVSGAGVPAGCFNWTRV
jgi:uncharacterized membrane protein